MLLYYLPNGDRNITLDQLRATPIGYAFEQRYVVCGCNGGPDDSDGIVVADTADAAKVGYFPDKQQWVKIPKQDRGLRIEGRTADDPRPPVPDPPICWLGKYAGPIAPESLARREPLAGHWVTLADGQEWLCPVARSFSGDDGPQHWIRQLPSAVTIDDDGNWTDAGVVDRYAHLWQIAERWFAAWCGAETTDSSDGDGKTIVEFNFAGGLDAALTCLQETYRLGKAEVSLLGLFDHLTPRVVLNALIDEPTYIEWFQKKSREEFAGLTTAAGSAASTPVTDPPSST